MLHAEESNVLPSVRIVRVGGADAENQLLATLLRGAGLPDPDCLPYPIALERIAARAADVILLDVMLTNVEIFQVLRSAAPSQNAPGIPVIVTGPPSAAERLNACLQHGAQDFIAERFDERTPLLVAQRVKLCVERARPDADRRAKDADATEVLRVHTDASNRFVPREFLEHLQRKSLADVRLGDHVKRSMTVFFSDIRDFTALSEQMTPEQNFNFLNSYLKQVNPIIRRRNGFIDKYIGDAIMALFPRSPFDALGASVELLHQVVKYNRGRRAAGYVPIRIGIGLHVGDLILGTIGEEERMQTTVISDAVNLASRIEGMTKTFRVPLLVSGDVVAGLPPGHGFKLRHLSGVKAKGKKKSIEIFECYDNDPEDLMQHKNETAELFERGMVEFRKGLFLTAGDIFARIAQRHDGDTVAAHYRDSCTLTAVSARRGGLDT